MAWLDGRFQLLDATDTLGLQMSEVNGLKAGRDSTPVLIDVLIEALPSAELNEVSADSGGATDSGGTPASD